ncbi:cyclin-domain-containing protein [Kockiozyma suomiensis]|uniref:cyclin-domain-containing protein n=1 Tax=Kockiozyma suomiensis TaxID=1337062 RepID=UPI0033435113
MLAFPTPPPEPLSMAADLSHYRLRPDTVLLSPAPSSSRRSPSRSPSPDSEDAFAAMAANITCLFWFSPTATLTAALSPSSSASSRRPLSPVCIPTPEFKAFAAAILSRTQVSHTVVAYALLYIFRLKLCSPAVVGTPGSEYRVFTIALVLANKFLDDNTYTNKTWAQVSKLPVHEIGVMEVEFLKHVRYSLAVSKTKWDEWGNTLACFVRLRKTARFACVSVPGSPVPVPLQQSFAYPQYISSQIPLQQQQQLPPPPPLPVSFLMPMQAPVDMQPSNKRKAFDAELFALSPISPAKRFVSDMRRLSASSSSWTATAGSSHYISPTTPSTIEHFSLSSPRFVDNGMNIATLFPPLLPKLQQFSQPPPPLPLPSRRQSRYYQHAPPPPPPPPPQAPPPHLSQLRPLLVENTYAQPNGNSVSRANPFVYPVVDKYFVPVPVPISIGHMQHLPPPPLPHYPAHEQRW